ncbi:probable peptidyl-tRNA hydrolase isoform X2 [Microtus oregoni]|uniref:probable peptidyl-tRNA hydrolase isoform X2 n=1 Tax=Microtus oregoni TaxID=111838 RepID=UPI001BB0E2E7|nr:probable peptidyl-tRNA hydrolase isoform X2 [Microtus oregoni]XP_041530482.1 probable peptidyl-tRNA hydrolase isoform X2 [Microtus oregoni]XP_041530483.1 probable peptidyl-tRNA hydrolase isoform X2 [Microtus oregoni]
MLRSGLFRSGMRRSWALRQCVSEARFPGKRWLVAGLGNHGMPGTRHSVGMAVLGQIARRLGVAESWARDSRCAADLALAPFGDAQLVLLRPRRLMNVNGRSVAQAAELFGLTAEEIYLVHDELDKPLGKLALKLGGSARGHNGVRSCISCLNSSAMLRLRVGIGRPIHPSMVQAHVLGCFSPEEQELLSPLLDQATDLLLDHIRTRSQGPPSSL